MASDRPPSRSVPAAVSTLSAAVVGGPAVPATVLGVHRFALYLDVGGRVLPVLTSDAVSLPTALRLIEPSGSLPWGVVAGDEALVGAGRVALPVLDIVTVRVWRPARARRVAAPSARLGEVDALLGTCAAADSGWLAEGIRAAVSGLGCSGACHGDHLGTPLRRDAVAGLVGRGPGLTPSGDDALAGALLVAHALGACDGLAVAVRARLGATTAVSAALLDAAADGYAARPVVTLVDAAVAGEPDAVRRALPAVLAIGHTSGADTVAGIRWALAAVAEVSTGRSAA